MKTITLIAALLSLAACDGLRMPTQAEIDRAAEVARLIAEGAQ